MSKFVIFLLLATVVIAKPKHWPPIFKDYPVDSIYKGKIAAPDFKTNKVAKYYKTMIKEIMKRTHECEFAGHFVICEWGCGSPCQNDVIVDAKTGRIYDGTNTCWSYKTQVNSKLFIANPAENAYGPLCSPEYYIWDKDKLKVLENK